MPCSSAVSRDQVYVCQQASCGKVPSRPILTLVCLHYSEPHQILGLVIHTVSQPRGCGVRIRATSHSTTDLALGAATPCWTGKSALFARTRSLAKVIFFCCHYWRRLPFSLFTFGCFPQPEVRHDALVLHKGVLLWE